MQFFAVAMAVNPHVAIVEPVLVIMWADVERRPLDVDLGACCPRGKLCCERCAHNMRFRGGHPDFCLPDEELIEAVLEGSKPVGTIARRKGSQRFRRSLEDCGLLIAQASKNRWGMVCYVFTTNELSIKRFSDFADLAVLEQAFGLVVEDRAVLEHAQSERFLNEEDMFVERGVLYGYPLWSSVLLDMRHKH